MEAIKDPNLVKALADYSARTADWMTADVARQVYGTSLQETLIDAEIRRIVLEGQVVGCNREPLMRWVAVVVEQTLRPLTAAYTRMASLAKVKEELQRALSRFRTIHPPSEGLRGRTRRSKLERFGLSPQELLQEYEEMVGRVRPAVRLTGRKRLLYLLDTCRDVPGAHLDYPGRFIPEAFVKRILVHRYGLTKKTIERYLALARMARAPVDRPQKAI